MPEEGVLMKDRAQLFASLAPLFTYPSGEYVRAVETCQETLCREAPAAAPLLERFSEQIRALSLAEQEELFTRTFDLNPICCLEVGWHLYGEDYNRGVFMVKMREQLRAQGIAESSELPDHITHLLPLLGRLEEEAAKQLAVSYLLPALAKMEEGLAGKTNPYEDVLRVVRTLVESQAPTVAEAASGTRK